MKGEKPRMYRYVTPRNVLIVLSAIIVVLIILNLITQTIQNVHQFSFDSTRFAILQRFNVDQETSIPTWYSQSALLAAAVLAVFIGWKTKVRGMKYVGWFALGATLLYMSVDEGASLHEIMSKSTSAFFQIQGGPFVSAWVIPGMIFAGIVGLFFLRFVLRQPRKTKALFFLSGAIFLLGTIGLEMVDSLLYTYYIIEAHDPTTQYMTVLRSLEEGMEMFGVALLIYAFMDFIRSNRLSQVVAQ